MTKDEEINLFKDIQSGDGVDRQEFPNGMKGTMAKQCWDDPLFTYGIEYGALIVLRKIYDITVEDLTYNKERVDERHLE